MHSYGWAFTKIHKQQPWNYSIAHSLSNRLAYLLETCNSGNITVVRLSTEMIMSFSELLDGLFFRQNKRSKELQVWDLCSVALM